MREEEKNRGNRVPLAAVCVEGGLKRSQGLPVGNSASPQIEDDGTVDLLSEAGKKWTISKATWWQRMGD